MKRSTLARFGLGMVTVVARCQVAARNAITTAAERTAARAAVAFDMSPPLALMAQFIPGRSVVIHPAVESPPERQGATKGPGTGLGATPPTPPVARRGAGRGASGRRAGGPPTIPPPPPAPEINAAGAAVEQTTQGTRAAIEPVVSFDGLGEGFTGHEFPGADNAADASAAAAAGTWRH